MNAFLPKRHTYLLTIWQESPAFRYSPPVWRIRLVDTRASCTYGFSTPWELLCFLDEQISAMEEPNSQSKEKPDE